MSIFRFDRLTLSNYRCFTQMDLRLEADLTLVFAENGGGKTTILTALAMGIAVFQPRSPRELKLDALRDSRKIPVGDGRQREPAGPCTVRWQVTTAKDRQVTWSATANPASGRGKSLANEIQDAIEVARLPGERWPLFAFYGTDRTRTSRRPGPKARTTQDRWDGYTASLDPHVTDAPLLEWMEIEILGDYARHKQNEPERKLDEGVLASMVRATPGVADAWYDPVERGPVARFENGHIAPWSELSDGYHAYLSLVGDIARRAVLLNELDGRQAPELVEGVVLIDEIDLHLHPRWQRIALDGLRRAFPKLQFIVTTHSPQVLSSAENRQVRRLSDWRLVDHGVLVAGRDSNAILREQMHTDDRDEAGVRDLRGLYDVIDQGRKEDAERLYQMLLTRWGDLDPELIRARELMNENVEVEEKG